MSTFNVQATFIHPEHRERSIVLDLLVDTGAFYTLLPAEVVVELGLPTPEARTVEFANGQREVLRMGEVRVRLGELERPTLFFAGAPGCRALLGAFTLEAFALAADPVHQRLIPIPILLV